MGGMEPKEVRKFLKRLYFTLHDPTLSDEDREIFELRWGIKFTRPHTLPELAKKYGRCVEGVRRVELRVLRKMREIFGDN